MDENRIHDGARLEIILERKLEEDSEFKLFSTFEEVFEDGRIVIAAPMWRSSIFPIEFGERINISFIRETNKYTFDAVVEDRLRKDNLPFLLLRQITPIIRIQRREHFRLNVDMPAKLVRTFFGTKKKMRTDMLVVDLSGGGVSAVLNEELQIGDKVGIILTEISGVETIEIPCEVRRVNRLNDNAAFTYSVGFMFKVVNKSIQDRIIKYIFKEQQHRMRAARGKGEG